MIDIDKYFIIFLNIYMARYFIVKPLPNKVQELYYKLHSWMFNLEPNLYWFIITNNIVIIWYHVCQLTCQYCFIFYIQNVNSKQEHVHNVFLMSPGSDSTLWVTVLILTTSWKHCLCPCSFSPTTIGANAQTTEFSVLHLLPKALLWRTGLRSENRCRPAWRAKSHAVFKWIHSGVMSVFSN